MAARIGSGLPPARDLRLGQPARFTHRTHRDPGIDRGHDLGAQTVRQLTPLAAAVRGDGGCELLKALGLGCREVTRMAHGLGLRGSGTTLPLS